MAILCLVLGVLSVVGSSSSQAVVPPKTTKMTTPMAPTNVPEKPTTTAAASPTVTPLNPGITTASVANTPAKTEPSVTAPHTTTIAVQEAITTTASNKAVTGASSSIASVPATSLSAGPVTTTKQTAISLTETTPSQQSASTAGNLVTTTLGRPQQETSAKSAKSTTELSQTSKATETILNSTISATVTKDPISRTTIHTTLSPSASPPLMVTSTTTASRTYHIARTKPMTSKFPSSSPSLPATKTELTTHESITSQKNTESNDVKKANKNIEVRCTNKPNLTNPAPYVRIEMKSSATCGHDSHPTEGGHSTEDTIFMSVCKAIKPGYQKDQDKCSIQLARNDNNELVIIEAFVESHVQPKDLYTQLKNNGENVHLFRYDGADPEDEDVVSIPLISAIVSLAVLLLIIAAAYGCWHQRKARKREQRLTEELQTMENGYHDNPTLEVMETSPEMQEKKGGPNGELGDSWIVPLDNLTREDLEEEEDTHL